MRVHPETGEKALFVNPNFTSHIVGLRNKESRALLDLLYAQIADPRYTVRFHWAPGSIAFWDNRATAHLAAFDAVPGENRTLHRITVRGDVPGRPGRLRLRVPRRRCVLVTAVEDRPQQLLGAPVRLIDLRTADEYEAEKRPRRRFPRGVERLVGVVLLLVVWQVAAWAGWISTRSLAGPVDVASTFWDMVTSGTLGSAVWVSLQRVVFGLAIGIPIGVLLAAVRRPQPHRRGPGRRPDADAALRADHRPAAAAHRCGSASARRPRSR